ncbi:GTPase [Trichothermofontia sp.]
MSSNGVDELFRFAEQCRQKIQGFENAEVRCALIGASGSGKSSLINAIAGERIAKVNVIETTEKAQSFKHQGILFTDLPGCGTVKWPRETYIENLDLLSYDCFLLITSVLLGFW